MSNDTAVKYKDFIKELNLLGYEQLKSNMMRDLKVSEQVLDDSMLATFLIMVDVYPDNTLFEHAKAAYNAASEGYLKRIMITGSKHAN